MVRVVHINTFGRMDLENMDPGQHKSRSFSFENMKAPAGCPRDRTWLWDIFWDDSGYSASVSIMERPAEVILYAGMAVNPG